LDERIDKSMGKMDRWIIDQLTYSTYGWINGWIVERKDGQKYG